MLIPESPKPVDVRIHPANVIVGSGNDRVSALRPNTPYPFTKGGPIKCDGLVKWYVDVGISSFG